MNVLIVGGGAREHALGWKLRQSARLTELFFAPGNAGTALVGTNLDIDPLDFEGIAWVCAERRVELVVIGPEDPLAGGLVDFLRERGIAAYGPTKAAARIEASKAFAKDLMRRAGIPTAESRVFDEIDGALSAAADLSNHRERTDSAPTVAGRLRSTPLVMLRDERLVPGEQALVMRERLDRAFGAILAVALQEGVDDPGV